MITEILLAGILIMLILIYLQDNIPAHNKQSKTGNMIRHPLNWIKRKVKKDD